MNKLITIIIPTFNRANLLQDTLDSIIAQNYPNWECIVVDDGSSDNTKQILESYIRKDKRFQYHHRPKFKTKGACSCRNYGFELSKGDYIKWFDSDDIMKPNFLFEQVNFLNANPNLDFVACIWEYFNEQDAITKNYVNIRPIHHPIYSYLLEGHIFATPSPLWKREFLINKSLFDETLMRSQEADFHFRMLTYNPQYVINPDFLFKVRRGHKSIESLSTNLEYQKSVLIYFKKVFNIIVNNTPKGLRQNEKKDLIQYLTYRISNLIYILYINGYISKNEVLITNFSLIRKNTINVVHRIVLGTLALILFKKGFSFIHLKKFDYRNEDWRLNFNS